MKTKYSPEFNREWFIANLEAKIDSEKSDGKIDFNNKLLNYFLGSTGRRVLTSFGLTLIILTIWAILGGATA